jgi:orotidine-5'-phosphate decarboxylase
MEPKGIIFAADIEDKDVLLDVFAQVSPFVEAVKIGNLLLYEFGWGIIRELKSVADKPVIADLKIMDTTFVAEKLARRALSNGADGIMVCGPIGGDAISACKKIFAEKDLYVFTQFTHFTGLIGSEMADEYIELALIMKCAGVQVPATLPDRVKEVRRKVGTELKILSCGVGRQGPRIGSAIASGADYEIIGRDLFSPEGKTSPAEAARQAREKVYSYMQKL